MNSIYRERFALTLAHKPVDRCPIDLGGTPQASVDDPALAVRLAEHLGFKGARPADFDTFDRRILERLDVDFRGVGDLVRFSTGRDRQVSDTEAIDCFGVTRRFDGRYWNIVGSPLAGATTDQVRAYDFPRVDQLAGDMDAWATKAADLYRNTPYVIAGWHPVYGVLELACWLCGYDHIMMMLALDPDFIHLLFGKILAFQKMVVKEYYSRMGKFIHLTTSGDDFGTQKGPFMSPPMWREFVKPYMKERIAYTTQFTDAVYMHHSCGSISDIIPDLAGIGVKILNPIQPVTGMNPARLKTLYGGQIVFHGGLDTQEVLPSNNPERIDESVERLISTMAPRTTGGYIFASAHNLQADVAPEAVARMFATALKCQT